MKLYKRLTLISICLTVVLIGCKDEDPGSDNFTIETVTETLNNQDVYFIFTNTSLTENSPVAPSISSSTLSVRSAYDAVPYYSGSFSYDLVPDFGIISEIAEFNQNESLMRRGYSRAISAPSQPSFRSDPADDDDSLGSESTDIFYIGLTDYDDPSITTDDPINATCRKVVTVDGKQLSIWVDDNQWTTGTEDGKINQVKVNAMADRFLITGTGNDIYDWGIELFGAPWGTDPNNYINLLGSTAADYITILLYDIDSDSSKTGGTVGYFWAKDNFLNTTYSGSNERIMFYMDSVLYGTWEDGSWDAGDYWPQSIFSTLGHEFQHMIHFYQKQILFDANETDTWINEMCSEVAEDMLADKIGIKGPRGILDVESVGSHPEYSSRLNHFNQENNDSLVQWNGSLYDYASVYSFGAFLARNYGGAALFQDIVQSSSTDESAVVNAVNSLNNTTKTFEDLLIEWGKAVLNSDLSNATYKYNIGGSFVSSPTLNGTEYKIGSINLNYYNFFDYDSIIGPKVYNGNISNPISEVILGPSSNLYYKAGSNLSGTHSWVVEVPKDTVLTVVKK